MHAYPVAQSCPTLYNPMDFSPPGSSLCEIIQAIILIIIIIRESSQPKDQSFIS